MVAFPAIDGHFVHAEQLCHVLLPKPQVGAPLPEVVSQGQELPGIGRRQGLLGPQPQMAKRQRGDVPAATSATRTTTVCAALNLAESTRRRVPAAPTVILNRCAWTSEHQSAYGDKRGNADQRIVRS